ncbi:hypothetical protein JCM17823_06770 [Halorubrum gandharaense]
MSNRAESTRERISSKSSLVSPSITNSQTQAAKRSNIDRLKAIELPDADAVADDIDNYLQTVERAEELDEKIERTDDLIDEIVYELYGLTDEEITIVEEAVGDDYRPNVPSVSSLAPAR